MLIHAGADRQGFQEMTNQDWKRQDADFLINCLFQWYPATLMCKLLKEAFLPTGYFYSVEQIWNAVHLRDDIVLKFWKHALTPFMPGCWIYSQETVLYSSHFLKKVQNHIFPTPYNPLGLASHLGSIKRLKTGLKKETTPIFYFFALVWWPFIHPTCWEMFFLTQSLKS